MTIKRILTIKCGYRRHEEKYFTFIKTIVLDGVSYDVDVDFVRENMAAMAGNVGKQWMVLKPYRLREEISAFDFPPTDVK